MKFKSHDRLMSHKAAAMTLNAIIPMLPVARPPRAVTFYEALGFAVEQREDQWGWARLSQGGCRIMLDQSINPHMKLPRPGVLYLYPEDVRVYWEAITGKGIAAPPPEPTFYGMLEFRLDDPDGNRLWIGQAQT